MELCESNLEEYIRQVRKRHQLSGLPPLDAVNLGLMLCSALRAVHRRARCVHLDVTPRNVLIGSHDQGQTASDDGQLVMKSAKLCDFGLARHLPQWFNSLMTGTKGKTSSIGGVAEGTAGFAPKEQLLRKGERRSDVYSLGTTMCFALTGEPPYSGTRTDIVAQVLEGVLFFPSFLPAV